MSLEKFDFEDLRGNKKSVDPQYYADSIVTIKLFRKIAKGDFTLLLVFPFDSKTDTLIFELSWIIKQELQFTSLLVEKQKETIFLIAPFQLEDWQRKKIIINLMMIELEHLKLKQNGFRSN